MTDDHSIGASTYIAALRRAAVSHIVTVPDFVQLALHQAVERGEGGMDVVRTCNEDQAVCVAAGLTVAGKRPLVVIQNQGLYACINTVRAVALDAQIPTVFLIGQFGRETENFEKPSKQSRRRVVSLLEPMLETLAVPYWRLEQADDLDAVPTVFDTARSRRGAAALIVGRPVAWH
ncbi:thiamine pyrophosphate-binding protein [Cupriavidus taiwanensis]|uniref:thiamine pyrophosphate-binding protein n=1 Tax=Cupriavidus taiwanensis TaxID=164546 RepID=UPI0025407B40|nr:thiamine pyrophosphate-binding protein [Cupriavidus taiwanensis]MDK3023148.1 thiamine pyrophosphate-binding protein [Cupriavidus taiwanensis]